MSSDPPISHPTIDDSPTPDALSEEASPHEPDESSEIPEASPINIRNLSVKCGRCGQYQVLASFHPLDEDWNQYVYECEWPPCDADVEGSRTLLEVPVDLDEFIRRDPSWHGGQIHAGAEHGAPDGFSGED